MKLVDALVLTFCADDRELLARIDLVATARRFRDYVAGLPPAYRLGFGALLVAFDWLAPLGIFRLPPFRRLALSDQQRCLRDWASSSLTAKRLAFMGIKFISLSQIYSDPRVLESVGYGPALRERREGACVTKPIS